MTIVQRFNITAALLAALSAGFIVLATSGASAGNHSHQTTTTASNHVAHSPPIIAKPGHDDHGHRGKHRRGFIFDYAQANYRPIDSVCELHRTHLDRYTDVVIVRRGKPCVAANEQVVITPGY